MRLLAALAAAALVVGVPVVGARADGATVDVVVRADHALSADERSDLAAALGGDQAAVVKGDTFVVAVPAAQAALALDRAGRADEVVWAAPDARYEAARVPSDDCYDGCSIDIGGQPELASIGAPAAWDLTTGSTGVTVAVLDNLADTSHPELAGRVVAGPDFSRTRCTRLPESSHGTAVAGIVGARTDDGVGVASLGWETSVLSVGVLDGCGVGTASGIAAGIGHAVDAGADVVNLSLTGPSHPVLGEAVAAAQQRGVLVVAAAGNDASATEVFPAAYPGVLAVGAADDRGSTLAAFSNRGPWVDLAAPGVGVLAPSTVGGGYASFSGTSFAAPFVSATAALVLARSPGLRATAVASRLRATAAPLAGVGAGRLDAGRAVAVPPGGYWLVGSDGVVTSAGDAPPLGGVGGRRLGGPVVGVAATPPGAGYWLVAGDGGVFAFGDARFHGSTGGRRLTSPVVGMAPTPSGAGYWLVAADGGIFSFGDAPFHGSTGGRRLTSPVVGMAPTPSGHGYWLVAADGGVFAFGDARFLGSTGGRRLTSPVVGLAATASGSGYWLVASDGGIFSFGDAAFSGSAGGRRLAAPVVGIATPRSGAGYWLPLAAGEVLAYGDAVEWGGANTRTGPLVGIAAS